MSTEAIWWKSEMRVWHASKMAPSCRTPGRVSSRLSFLAGEWSGGSLKQVAMFLVWFLRCWRMAKANVTMIKLNNKPYLTEKLPLLMARLALTSQDPKNELQAPPEIIFHFDKPVLHNLELLLDTQCFVVNLMTLGLDSTPFSQSHWKLSWHDSLSSGPRELISHQTAEVVFTHQWWVRPGFFNPVTFHVPCSWLFPSFHILSYRLRYLCDTGLQAQNVQGCDPSHIEVAWGSCPIELCFWVASHSSCVHVIVGHA